MSKKLLSLALALVMCLGLTIPAFAAESKWKVEVVGKTDAEISLGKKTFTVRDWVISGTFKDDEFDMIGNIWTKTDSHQWTAENVYALSKGDEVVFTKGGESFEEFYMTAWSDPDGDGVYDQLIGNITSEDYSSTFLPANAAGPVRDFYAQTYTLFYMPSLGYLQQMGLTPDGYGSWDLTDTGGVSPVTELKMSPDFLLDIYGANTIVNIMTPDKSWNCTILVEGNTTQPTVPTVGGFTDVKTGDYFADPVLWAVEKKITAGTSATTFAPNATCTQSQILTFLWRAKGEPKPTGTVSGTQYYATAAQWAKEQGLTDNYSAEADCTRAMVVTYLWKLAGSPKTGTSNFTDVSANADYAQAVAWAVEQGITGGTGNGQFSPASTCTRGQIVTFLYRAFAK
ncbi:S-layer homology domain-containing protein [Oscillospiraceae bacterium 44-34]